MGDLADTSWVAWFLQTPRGSIFIQIDSDYLNTNYNYYGLRQKVPNFKYSLDLIRGPYIQPESRPPEWPADIDDYGLCLYGLLHARYLLTVAGQEAMRRKFTGDAFPRCPRMLCRGCVCLPYGQSDDIAQSSVQLFCPNCQDVYASNDPKFANMDGAFFGPNWVHFFLGRYPSFVPREQPEKYVPRIFGFRVARAEATAPP
jgi:casein kinase II subunit beta